MTNIIGQRKLLEIIDNYSLSSFPNTCLLLGEKGSGKHTVVNYLGERFGLPVIDLTDVLSHDVIDNIYRSSQIAFYVINLDKFIFADKEQNSILKFIEEPLQNSFVVLIAENKQGILETISNRCIQFSMDKYSDDELLKFSDNVELIKYIRTPGKLLSISANINDIKDLSNKIIDSMGKAHFANALTIANKFNYADNYDKIDIEIFIDLLLSDLYERYVSCNDIEYYNLYMLVSNEKKKLRDKRLNKKIFMQHLIIKLWRLTHNE